MVFDKTSTKLSSFINEVPAEDLSAIALLVFSRVGTLDQPRQERFIEEIQHDPHTQRIFQKLQAYNR